MKRLILLLLICLLPCAALAAPSAELYESALPENCLPTALCAYPVGALPQADAIDLALLELALRCDIGSDAMDDYACRVTGAVMSNGETVCAVSMFSQAYHPIDAVLLLDKQGNVLRFESTSIGWFRQPQTRWEAVYGPFGRWALDKQAMFDELYYLEQTHALLPDGCLSETAAVDAAIEAAGLTSSREHVTYERALALNKNAQANEAYVWMITLSIGGSTVAQVNLSAVDGHVVDMFIEEVSVG